MKHSLSTRLLAVVLCSALVAVAARVSRAQDETDPSARRLVHMFDFEEADKGNFEDLPIHWYVMGRPSKSSDPQFDLQPLHRELVGKPGFPRHGEATFDKPQRERGVNHRFYLGVNGSSVGAFLAVGAVPVVPGSDYVIGGDIETSTLQFARARIVAYFVTRDGKRIDASVVASAPITTDGQTHRVSVRLPGDYPDAAWLGMQLEVLQPQASNDSPLGKQQIVYTDVRGGAWFDNIGVWQVPRVAIHTQSDVNVIVAPQQPILDIIVRDLSGESLVATIDVHDHQRRKVASLQRPIGRGSAYQWQWTPPLGGYGWYRVDLRVIRPSGPAAPLARATSAFLWRPREMPRQPGESRRFTLDASGAPVDQLALVPRLLDASQLNSVVVSAWTPATTTGDVEGYQAWLDDMLEPVHRGGGIVTLSLDPLPRALMQATHMDAGGPIWVVSQSGDAWRPYVAPVFMRHGQRIRQWQLGSADRPDAFDLADLGADVTTVVNQFHTMTPQPKITIPWRLDQPRRDDLTERATYLMDVPPAVQPRYLAEALQPWTVGTASQSAVDVDLRLRQATALETSNRRRVDAQTLTMLEGWRAQVHGMTVTRPWTWMRDRKTMLVPDPLLGAFITTAHRLAGRSYVGRFEPREGMEAMVFDGPAGGMMAVWNETALPGEDELNLYLGAKPTLVDVWGNRRELSIVDSTHHVRVSSTPVFIEGIDSRLAMLRASMRIEPEHVESTREPHEHTITITNPWPNTMTGVMQITGPAGWTFSPSRFDVAIASGQTRVLPVMVTFPVAELAGRKTLVMRASFVTDKRYDVDLTSPMTLGLKDIEFDANLHLETSETSGGVDAVATILITNRGEQSAHLHIFASLPGYPRQERLVSNLRPGQSVVRGFRFPRGATALVDNRLRVGIRDANGPAMLNQVLGVDVAPAGLKAAAVQTP